MATRLKHRWSLGHNYLAGITADAWWRLLRENRFEGLPPETRERVAQAWRRSFEEWGYPA